MDTKQKIIVAAAREFSEKGFLRTTMRGISKRAGINHAGINYHFSTKKDLYLEVMTYLFEETARFDAPRQENIHSAKVWQEAIRQHLLRIITNISGSNKLMRWKHTIIFREMVEPSNMLPVFYERFIKEQIANLKYYLKFGLPAEVTEEELNFRALAIISQCIFYEQNREFVKLIMGGNFWSPGNLERLAGIITENTCRDLHFRTIPNLRNTNR